MATEQEEVKYSRSTVRATCCHRPMFIVGLIWGLLTAVGLLAVGIHTLITTLLFWIAVYQIVVGGIVTVLEVGLIFANCGCCRENGCCQKVGRPVRWFDNWKRGFIYVLFGIVCLVGVFRNTPGILCGVALIIAGIIYTMKTCKDRPLSKTRRSDVDRKQLAEEFIGEQRA
ncbi:uncharacterized protein LOC117301452 [Asterias rubens]|uniref:uncharacterized protein LOC117301452 n=1 Tax=Asterias rubens TaxID=7604 RepID=UPI001455A224|nr:uncharacterized protein LOC117301452 [Asterias rubens]